MAKTFAPQYALLAKKLNVYGTKHAASMASSLEASGAGSTFSNLQAALAAFLIANPVNREKP